MCRPANGDIRQLASSLQCRWVIEGAWKEIVPAEQNVPAGKAELFNVVRDPHERDEVAGKHPEQVARLTKRLDAWWAAKE